RSPSEGGCVVGARRTGRPPATPVRIRPERARPIAAPAPGATCCPPQRTPHTRHSKSSATATRRANTGPKSTGLARRRPERRRAEPCAFVPPVSACHHLADTLAPGALRQRR